VKNSIFYLLRWTRRSRFRLRTRNPLKADQKPFPLEFSNRIRVALGLHVDYNRAMAYGDKRWISQATCRGVQKESYSMIDNRRLEAEAHDRGMPIFDWSIQSYTGSLLGGIVPPYPATSLPVYSYRVLADTVGAVPVGKDVMLRQCVVRISSRQQLLSAKGALFKDTTDYVVLQKSYWNGKEDPWLYWGTIEPITIDKFQKMLDKKPEDGEESITERIRNIMAVQAPPGGP
jgi:hypothetical protein